MLHFTFHITIALSLLHLLAGGTDFLHLAQLPRLKRLVLFNTNVTEARFEKLKQLRAGIVSQRD